MGIKTKKCHSEGHTSVCFDDSGKNVLTCGIDGKLRICNNRIDADADFEEKLDDKLFSLALKDDKIFVSTGTNSVDVYTFPDVNHDEVIVRFKGVVNHIDIGQSGKYLLAGSSDYGVKLVDLADNSVTLFRGHDGPVLSVAMDPMDEYVASSSCDGTIKIWQISSTNCVKTIHNVLPQQPDINSSSTLCRLHWMPTTGNVLAVPQLNYVQIYERSSWDKLYVLKEASVNEEINIVRFSTCGEFIAAASIQGTLLIWKVQSRKLVEKHEHGEEICGLVWNPSNKREIVFCDKKGQLNILDNIIAMESVMKKANARVVPLADSTDEEDDDENTFSIEKIKAETIPGYLQDNEDDLPVITHKPRKSIALTTAALQIADEKSDLDINEESLIGVSRRDSEQDFQMPFQPASTPCHLKQRYLVWNYVGMIRSYRTEEENTIEIDFHNTAFHSGIFMENVHGHTMGALSYHAAVLASVGQENKRSKLVCLHFSSWDSNKEWTVDMPSGETIQAVAVGEEWVAAVTDSQHLRIFTISGLQREVLFLPGRVVSASGSSKYLVIAYHRGSGLPGSQCLRALLVTVNVNQVETLWVDVPLPKKSQLSWIGFTDEGTACVVDSRGVVSLLMKRITGGPHWMVIGNTKTHVKGKSDHCFVVSVSERRQQIRYLLCKGSKYPAVVPRPGQMTIPFQCPLADPNTEKGQLEDSYWKNKLLMDTVARLDAEGFDTDTMADIPSRTCRRNLLKLFAMSCNEGMEFRATDYYDKMDSETATLAIKYAVKLNRPQLVELLRDKLKVKTYSEKEDGELEVCVETEKRRDFQTAPSKREDVTGTETQMESSDERVDVTTGSDVRDVTVPGKSSSGTGKRCVNPFKVVSDGLEKSSLRGLQLLDTLEKTEPKKKKEFHLVDVPRTKSRKREIAVKRQSTLLFTSKSKQSVANPSQDKILQELPEEMEELKEVNEEGNVTENLPKKPKPTEKSSAISKLARFAYSK